MRGSDGRGHRGPQADRFGDNTTDAAPEGWPGKRPLTASLRQGGGISRALAEAQGRPGHGAEGPPGASASSGPQLDVGRAPGAAASGPFYRRAPPTQVAEAKSSKKPEPVVLKVVAYRGGKHVGSSSGNGSWEGPLPATYRGTKNQGGWTWQATAEGRSSVSLVRTIRLTKEISAGESLEQWAARKGADQIMFYATLASDVVDDQEAKPDARAPGMVDEEDAGDGTGREVRAGEHRGGRGDSGATHERGARGRQGGTGKQLGATAKEKRAIDQFEHSIGIGSGDGYDDEDTGEHGGGHKHGGKGKPGGDPNGRTGEDSSLDGKGPGGAKARAGGDGKGGEGGGAGGTERGSRDGKKGGDPEGMVGGEEGATGDGVPMAMGLFGGLIAVPNFLKGFVDVALILFEADFTGFGKKVLKETVEHLVKQGAKQASETTAASVRSALASEARKEARTVTKKATKAIATDKGAKAAWAKATKAEKAAFQRKVYYDAVSKFYDSAATQAKQRLEDLLKQPATAAVKSERAALEAVQDATKVRPVAGRLPQNHGYAGKAFPAEQLPAKYRKQGLKFTEQGYPDFEPHALQLPNGGKTVSIEYTGKRAKDFAAAKEAAGLKRMPDDYSWHHVEDGNRMMLVPDDLHEAVKHSGGVATYKHTTGVAAYE